MNPELRADNVYEFVLACLFAGLDPHQISGNWSRRGLSTISDAEVGKLLARIGDALWALSPSAESQLLIGKRAVTRLEYSEASREALGGLSAVVTIPVAVAANSLGGGVSSAAVAVSAAGPLVVGLVKFLHKLRASEVRLTDEQSVVLRLIHEFGVVSDAVLRDEFAAAGGELSELTALLEQLQSARTSDGRSRPLVEKVDGSWRSLV